MSQSVEYELRRVERRLQHEEDELAWWEAVVAGHKPFYGTPTYAQEQLESARRLVAAVETRLRALLDGQPHEGGRSPGTNE